MPTPLEQCQTWFEQHLLNQTTVTPPPLTVRGAGRLTPQAAMAVYQRAYLARLSESLGNTYPAVWRVLGDANFFDLARAYINAYPSDSYNLADYGHHLPTFLSTSLWLKSLPFLTHLARFEWLFSQVFHAPSHQPLANQYFMQLASINSGDIQLVFAPSLRLFAAPYQVYAIWQLREQQQAALNPEAWHQPQQLMLLKQGQQTYCYPLEFACFIVLSSLANTATLAAGLQQAQAAYPNLSTADVKQALQLVLQVGGIVAIV